MVKREKDSQESEIQAYDFGKTDLASNVKNIVGNRFLGMDVDPATKRFFDVILNQFLPHVAVKVEEHGVGFIKDLALSTGIATNEAHALTLGKKYAGPLALATVLAEPIISVGATAYDTANRVNELRVALTPISKGSGARASTEALFGSNNEVVQNARSHIYEHLYADIAGTVARTIVTLPALYFVRGQIKDRVKSQHSEEDLALAIKDPEARRAYTQKFIQERVKSGGDFRHALEEEKFKEVKTRREAYQKEFDTYAQSPEGKNAHSEIIRKIKEDSSYAYELGISNALNRQTSDGKTVRDSISDTRYRTGKSYRRSENSEIERAVEKELRYRFVEDVKFGQAFDKTWIKQRNHGWGSYNQSSEKSVSTVEDGIEHAYKEMLDTMLGKQKAAQEEMKKHEGDPNKFSIFEQGLMAVSSLVGNQFHKTLVGSRKEDLSQPKAMHLIMHLRKVIHEAQKEHQKLETVPNYGDAAGDSSYVKFIHKIFEQHQLDSKKSEIGSRYFEHFKEVNFSDEAIFKMADKDLSAYEVAIKHIARNIKEGHMDAIALVNLVGQRRIVQKDAKHFGPKGSNGAPSAIIEEIHKQCAENAVHAEVTQEQISEFLANIVLSEDELKTAFKNGQFKGDEKAFLFLLLESQVQDEKTMKHLTGLSVEAMQELRKVAQQKFTEHFDAAVSAIAAMSDEDITKLAKYDITPEEVRIIRDAAETARTANKSVEDTVTGDESLQLKTAVANVIMAEEKEGKNFWQNRVKAKASEALDSAVSEALKVTPSESALARLSKERDFQHEQSTDQSLGTAP